MRFSKTKARNKFLVENPAYIWIRPSYYIPHPRIRKPKIEKAPKIKKVKMKKKYKHISMNLPRFRDTGKSKEVIRRYKERNPHKIEARKRVYIGIRNGSITRQPCVICGLKKVDAHHKDYSKPLDIMWLCRKHHWEWHANHETLN